MEFLKVNIENMNECSNTKYTCFALWANKHTVIYICFLS